MIGRERPQRGSVARDPAWVVDELVDGRSKGCRIAAIDGTAEAARAHKMADEAFLVRYDGGPSNCCL